MTDVTAGDGGTGGESLGAVLSAEETRYFETGGETDISGGGAAPEGAEGAQAGGDDGKGADGKTDGKAGEGDGKTPAQQLVKLEALHDERTRRREAEKQARKFETELAELRGKFSIVDKLVAPKEQQAEPTVETDIFGVAKNLEGSVAEIKKRLDDQAAADKETREHTAIVNGYQSDVGRFKAANPDFDAAYQHLIGSRVQELIALGYDNEKDISEAIMGDEFVIAQKALTSGKSPAQILYKLAEQRGYKKAAADGGKGKGAEKLDTIERGQAGHKSLGNTGGSSGDVEMTGEALLKMPMDEFQAWCDKNPAKAKRIMGG